MVSASDGWAVGEGIALHWDGTKWQSVANPSTSGWLNSVVMVSADDGWAVGPYNDIFRWDGASWQSVATPTSKWLLDVAMVSATDGWIVGGAGTLLRWNGTNWGQVTGPTSSYLESVGMVSAMDGWAVGDYGAMLHWDGTSWQNVPGPAPYLCFPWQWFRRQMAGASERMERFCTMLPSRHRRKATSICRWSCETNAHPDALTDQQSNSGPAGA